MLAILTTTAARAQNKPDLSPAPNETLRWEATWRRVGYTEYAATGASVAGSFAIQLLVKSPNTPHWTGPIVFDDAARNGLRLSSRSARDRAGLVSDIMFISAVAHPIVVDAIGAAWLGHGSADVAWQLTVIDSQAYAATMLLDTIAKRSFGRERPYGEPCNQDPDYGPDCTKATRRRSFYSGHSAMTATAAGLTCSHHAHLPLYGGGWKDTAACVGAIGFTLATGSLRIASDNHWATDVVTGHLIGFATGLAMPEVLYYVRDDNQRDSHPSSSRIAVLPSVTERMLGLQATGWF
ncbi:MAG: phosphatase PAP2 family protein [Polyangiaceae bacterium]|jgi:membrane-associated phospholipid phosphatase|nr:phosphatase PAP2 family protein [Polyangiaceae bacterium]